MANQKYYAVKKGKVPGIYTNWPECQENIKGFSGAVYKAFTTLKAAEEFINAMDIIEVVEKKESENIEDLNLIIEKKISNLDENEVAAFVDGSYNKGKEVIGYGCIIIDHNGVKEKYYNTYSMQYNTELVAMMNVGAEIKASEEAIDFALKNNKKKITIFYDYEGIEKWATGLWKANKTETKKYVEKVRESRKSIDINFFKVPAHAGVIYNEEADELAKYSLLAKGHRTNKDGSVYFVGYAYDDWKSIVDLINTENKNLSDNDPMEISIDKAIMGNGIEKIIIKSGNDYVSINLYSSSKSYVQGKPSVLFSKIIATAIEMLTNNESVVETLNSYHALTLEKTAVEVEFDRIIPNYKEQHNSKIYSCLLSGVYNTMLTGYMPDYTCLVTPVFRALEYVLHRILSDTMGLTTQRPNGSNNFAFFDKMPNNSYNCTANQKNLITSKQLDFLNRLYTKYHGVRHVYSHWSYEDFEVAMIPNIADAKSSLLDCLQLINEYYILF